MDLSSPTPRLQVMHMSMPRRRLERRCRSINLHVTDKNRARGRSTCLVPAPTGK